jgi:hypothetical protein
LREPCLSEPWRPVAVAAVSAAPLRMYPGGTGPPRAEEQEVTHGEIVPLCECCEINRPLGMSSIEG